MGFAAMTALFSAWSRALGQLREPRFLRVILIGAGGAIGVFVALWVLAYAAYVSITWTALPVIGPGVEWLLGLWLIGDLFAGGAFLAVMVAVTYFLFPAVMTGIVSVFLEDVVDLVDARHFPAQGKARDLPVAEAVLNALGFFGVVLAVNLIALPFYAVFFLIFGFGLLLYYFVNGYLIGREYFEMVAFRRLDRQQARALRLKHRGSVLGFGVVAAFLMTLPIVNLVAPALAAAAMAHLFMRLQGIRPEGPGAGAAGGFATGSDVAAR